ncbi:Plasma kallikrein [Bulinus truncatus]|nr:Plasma kallikrein [Bulinus truncatus]
MSQIGVTETAPTCVYGSVKPSSKIYGGINATLGEFPWVAMILRNGVFLCGSTIIDPTHVLTAAHCFDSYSNSTSYEIFAGRLTFNLDVIDEGQQRISIRSFTIHEGYNKQSASKVNDLAVITLTSPLTITNYVTPACLPSSSDSLDQYCTVVGWGSTEDQQKPPSVLLKVRLQTYNATECLKTFEQTSQNIFTFVSANSICAANGTYGGLDACKGDSGGPLMCMKQSPDNSFRYLVFGIVSNGNGCALPGEPGVYTRVANYLDWIYDKIQQS